MEVTAYLRLYGIVCYEAPLLAAGPQVLPTLQAARLTDLAWHWLSMLRVDMEGRQDRRLTRLSLTTETLFLEDVSDRDLDGYGRAIALIGSAPERVFPDSAADLRGALASFARGDVSCVEVVVTQLGDSPVEQVFISTNPPARVRLFLAQCGLDVKPTHIRKYRTLRSASLESVIDSIAAHAFDKG
jgi:hypothetical protein